MSTGDGRSAGAGTRWLVTGASGMLGTELVRRLRSIGAEVVAADHTGLDITDPTAVRRALIRDQPHVVVNCAAYTSVDEAEADEGTATRVNGDGPRVLAEACATDGGRLVHISTDYVFPGDGETPWAEYAPVAPTTAYGRSKLAGEQAVLETLPRHGIVVRTAWLYSVFGSNFVKTMLRLERERDTLQVVDDQYGQPTWARDVASRLISLGRHQTAAGVFHATAAGETTWYEFAREIFRLKGADPDRIRPIPSQASNRAARRPAYSVLGHERWAETGIDPLPDWRVSLAQAFEPSDARQTHLTSS